MLKSATITAAALALSLTAASVGTAQAECGQHAVYRTTYAQSYTQPAKIYQARKVVIYAPAPKKVYKTRTYVKQVTRYEVVTKTAYAPARATYTRVYVPAY